MRNALQKYLLFPLVALLLLWAGSAAAQADRGLFWKVEKDGNISYLFGTVHVWRREWLPLHPGIEKAFADAKTLAVELDPAKMDMAGAVQAMLLGSNETLEGRLG